MCALAKKRKSSRRVTEHLIVDGNDEKSDLTIFWRIENVGLLEMKDNCKCNMVSSPHFATRFLEKVCFRLSLDTMFQKDDEEYLLVKLYSDEDWDRTDIECELSLMGHTGSYLVSATVSDPVVKKYRSLVLLESIKLHDVFVTRRCEFLPLDTLTFRFRLWNNDKALTETEFISARSRLEVAENTFRWPIERFSSLDLYQEVVTPVRLGLNNVSNNFFLKFSLRGKSLEDAGTHVALTAISLPVASWVSLKVSVLHNECRAIECTTTKSEVFEAGSPETWTLADFAFREELLRKNSYCLENDVLQLLCEISSVQRVNFIENHFHGIPFLKINILERYIKGLAIRPHTDPPHFFKSS